MGSRESPSSGTGRGSSASDGRGLIYPLTEAAPLAISLFFLLRYQKRYSYSLRDIRIVRGLKDEK